MHIYYCSWNISATQAASMFYILHLPPLCRFPRCPQGLSWWLPQSPGEPWTAPARDSPPSDGRSLPHYGAGQGHLLSPVVYNEGGMRVISTAVVIHCTWYCLKYFAYLLQYWNRSISFKILNDNNISLYIQKYIYYLFKLLA